MQTHPDTLNHTDTNLNANEILKINAFAYFFKEHLDFSGKIMLFSRVSGSPKK